MFLVSNLYCLHSINIFTLYAFVCSTSVVTRLSTKRGWASFRCCKQSWLWLFKPSVYSHRREVSTNLQAFQWFTNFTHMLLCIYHICISNLFNSIGNSTMGLALFISATASSYDHTMLLGMHRIIEEPVALSCCYRNLVCVCIFWTPRSVTRQRDYNFTLFALRLACILVAHTLFVDMYCISAPLYKHSALLLCLSSHLCSQRYRHSLLH